MPRKTLTDRVVEAATVTIDGMKIKLPPASGQVELFDALLPGFGVRISYGGQRSYVVMTRVRGRQIRRKVGTTATHTLAQAREAAREIIRSAAEGVDIGSRKARDEAASLARAQAEREKKSTFRAVAEAYLKDASRGGAGRLRTRDELRRKLEKDVFPVWGALPVREITRADVRELVRTKARRSPVAANRVLAVIKRVFGWAIDQELIDASPAVRIPPPGEETERERVLTDSEIARLWPAFTEIGYPFGDLFKVLLLTGQRRSEVGGMRWKELEGDVWRLPGERTKSGKGHLIALAPQVTEILEGIGRIDNCEHVFTTAIRGDRPVSGWSRVKKRIDKMVAQAAADEAGEPLDVEKHALEPWSPHDLRRSCATGLTSLGIDRLTVSKVLNHAEAGVTKIYDRYARDQEKRRAWEAWAAHVQAVVSGEPLSSNVVSMTRARE